MNTKIDYKKFDYNELLRIARHKSHLTQKQVYPYIGIAQSVISQYENGTRIPSPRNIKKLIKLYNPPQDLEAELIEQYNNLIILSPNYQLHYIDISEAELEKIGS